MSLSIGRAGMLLLAIAYAVPAQAVPAPVPLEFQGEWTAARGDCNSPLRFEVGEQSLTLRSGEINQALTRLDLCYSCEGGAAYVGRSVWLMALGADGKALLVARFNPDERIGAATVELRDPALAQGYRLNGLTLRKCPGGEVLPYATGKRP